MQVTQREEDGRFKERFEPLEVDHDGKLTTRAKRKIAAATEDPRTESVKIHKPGSRCIVKGTEYVYHDSGQWRNQTTGDLVDDPAKDAYHDEHEEGRS